MRRLAFVGFAFGVTFGVLGLAAGCGSDEDDGGGGPAADAGGGAGGDAAVSGPMTSALGKRCTSDADCPGVGLVCLTSDGDGFVSGGPANGMCVADCTVEGPDACAVIDATAICLTVAGTATARDTSDDISYCVPSCFVGDESDLSNKCQGREDVSCITSSQPPIGYCWPTCRNDLDCDGRVCDLGLGLCVDPEDIPDAGGFGAECEVAADCQGLCLGLSETFAFCSGRCTLGSVGCGTDPSSTDPLDAACLYPDDVNGGIGDSGFCFPLCDCNDDCGHPDAVCEPLSSVGQSATNRMGTCFIADLGGDAGRSPGLPCSSGALDGGGAGGAGGAGGTGGTGGATDAGSNATGGANTADASTGGTAQVGDASTD